MNEPPEPGIRETATLRADGTIELAHLIVWPDDVLAHGDELVKPGTPKYKEVLDRHPNLKVGEPDKILLPLPEQKENPNPGKFSA